MGVYINPGNEGFRTVRNGRYVDKSGLVGVMNGTIDTKRKLSCISRPRRFGKSYAAQMLCAYYDRSCDSAPLFDDLAIARDASYHAHLNRYNVLYLDITNIIGEAKDRDDIVPFIRRHVCAEVHELMPEIAETDSISVMLAKMAERTGCKFIAIIDEWDALVRDGISTDAQQKTYFEFLRSLFKSSGTTDKLFAAAYMTGILPIKKDGSQSAVSEFIEYDMLDPQMFEPFVGFTEAEVRSLCVEHGADFGLMKQWYDGYAFSTVRSVYNPNSVMKALQGGKFKSYWQMTSASDSLLTYLNMGFDGLAQLVPKLIAGIPVAVNVRRFKNDLVSFASKDDVLTLLIHFGYLSYDADSETVRIPNDEIRREFADILHDVSHADTIRRVEESDRLICDTVEMHEEAVAASIEKVHAEECAPIFYNSEQSLRSVIKLAYFAYRDYYVKFEELPAGTGYADIVYLPKKDVGLPALVVELKWNEGPEGAIAQIKRRNYPAVLRGFGADILLVGISYGRDDKDKRHHCKMERVPPAGAD